MKYYSRMQQEESLQLANKAAEWFKHNPQGRTFAMEDIRSGELIAIRHGNEGQHIVVLRVDYGEEPTTYSNFIPVGGE